MAFLSPFTFLVPVSAYCTRKLNSAFERQKHSANGMNDIPKMWLFWNIQTNLLPRLCAYPFALCINLIWMSCWKWHGEKRQTDEKANRVASSLVCWFSYVCMISAKQLCIIFYHLINMFIVVWDFFRFSNFFVVRIFVVDIVIIGVLSSRK